MASSWQRSGVAIAGWAVAVAAGVAAFVLNAVNLSGNAGLTALNAELLRTVRTTMSPAHASVWIRPPIKGWVVPPSGR